MKNIIILATILSIVSCGKTKTNYSFHIEELISSIIVKDNECNATLTKNHPIDPNDIRTYNFLDGISYRIANELTLEKGYERAILIRTYESGETIHINSYSILIFANGDTLISKHIIGKPLTETSRTIKGFKVKKFYEFLNKEGLPNKKDRNYITVIDFNKRESCNCSTYGKVSYRNFEKFTGFNSLEM
ncbi:hypothetical protein [Aquimarina megaterium]|uniref:hypothetical protein n=1 Tax=Aquimarina megaterium TaxID=1443666 RepID=UPI00046F0AA9|nr:hypothetical protein [Aquimarina megaterium]